MLHKKTQFRWRHFILMVLSDDSLCMIFSSKISWICLSIACVISHLPINVHFASTSPSTYIQRIGIIFDTNYSTIWICDIIRWSLSNFEEYTCVIEQEYIKVTYSENTLTTFKNILLNLPACPWHKEVCLFKMKAVRVLSEGIWWWNSKNTLTKNHLIDKLHSNSVQTILR